MAIFDKSAYWVKMKNKLILILAMIFTQLEADMMLEGKPRINFYTQDQIMWLIDTRGVNIAYTRRTFDEYDQEGSPCFKKDSYEIYTDYVNTHPEYKYSDWRLPTLAELKTLIYKGGWIRKIFTSSHHIKNDIYIDRNIFYDIDFDSDASYWASDKGKPTKDGVKTFGHIYFGNKRFTDYYWTSGVSNGRGGAAAVGLPSLKHKGGEGVKIGYYKYTSDSNIRLVRDIHKEESTKAYKTVRKNPSAIKDIKNPSEFLRTVAIIEDSSVIRYFKTPTEKEKLLAVSINPNNLQYIKSPTQKIYLAYLHHNPQFIKNLKELDDDSIILAIRQNKEVFRYLSNPSESVKLAVVKYYPNEIKYIQDPSTEVQFVAVKNDPYALSHIKNPSEALQLLAVKKYGGVIQYIENPSDEVQLVAVKKYGRGIQYIKNPSEAVQLAAVKNDPFALGDINNPSEEVQLAALKKDKTLLHLIHHPSQKVLDFVNNGR